jgi:hypothetical protein
MLNHSHLSPDCSTCQVGFRLKALAPEFAKKRQFKVGSAVPVLGAEKL